ncbi:MAG: DNA polymerase III subunit beta [Deltaproteobacteria bacterium]|nr:MAG: DNA polymerase III subunit beta [Deltaproteobacteria bacterium]
MEITVKKNHLVNGLQKIQYILEKTSALQYSQNILITAADDILSIIACDIDCSAKATLPSTIKEAGTICVNGKKIFEIIRNLDDEDIVIKKDGEENLVTIKGKKSFFHILSAKWEDFPVLNFDPPDDYFTIEAATLKNLIERTIFSVARISDPRYNLEGIYVEVGPEAEEEEAAEEQDALLTFVSTDGHRVSVAKTDKIDGHIQLGENRIFSRKSLVEIKNVFDDEEKLKISFTGNDVYVTGETFIMVLRLLKGNFPDYRKMIPTTFSHEIQLNREDFLRILRRMNVLAYDKYKGIIMSFSENKLTININNPEMGNAQEDMQIPYHGEPFTVSFNIRYLLDFLQVSTAEHINLFVSGGMQPCIFREEGNDNYLNGVMPMKS